MSNLVPGVTVALRCLGNVEGPRFLDGRTGNGSVGLAPQTGGHFTGTHWTVIDDGGANLILKCMGDVNGPRFLDGRTGNDSVGLAPDFEGNFTGAHWQAIDDGPNRVVLKCLGNIEGPRFLDGRTGNGTVGLAPATINQFTGTHWELVDPINVETMNFDTGPVTSGLPLGGSAHVVMRRNGGFTFNSHAHDSGFDNIDYTISAAVVTPAGIAFTFQHSGHVEGTIAGLPFGTPNRDNDFTTGGVNTQITTEWGGLVGAKIAAHLDGTDTLVRGLGGALDDVLKAALAEVGKEAATGIIALVFS